MKRTYDKRYVPRVSEPHGSTPGMNNNDLSRRGFLRGAAAGAIGLAGGTLGRAAERQWVKKTFVYKKVGDRQIEASDEESKHV